MVYQVGGFGRLWTLPCVLREMHFSKRHRIPVLHRHHDNFNEHNHDFYDNIFYDGHEHNRRDNNNKRLCVEVLHSLPNYDPHGNNNDFHKDFHIDSDDNHYHRSFKHRASQDGDHGKLHFDHS